MVRSRAPVVPSPTWRCAVGKTLFALTLALTSLSFHSAPRPDETPQLLRKPTLSRTHVVFSLAGDLWIVGRGQSDAQRLTTGIGLETDPRFSPDGTWVAFSGAYDGNVDVYVIPAAGGVPRRLTWHPGVDRVEGWTPDGKSILFRSRRASYNLFDRLFTISLDGGPPTELPLPIATEGAFSPDGKRLAYVPLNQWQPAWKRYRGGQTTPIWIANLEDSSVEPVPRRDSNDSHPMWMGDRLYFLSDREGPVTLYAYDAKTKQVSQAIDNGGLDFKSASAGPDAIIYEQFGSLYFYQPAAGVSRRLNIRAIGDFPEVRPRYVKVAKKIASGALSPSGARALFAVRGEILTVPAEKGDIRNVTRSPGAAERDPAWSPDGQRIAYLSDESGEYALHIRDQSGLGEVEKVHLGEPPSFFYQPRWSPDGRKIAFTDKRLNLWYVDVEKGGPPLKVATDTYDRPDRSIAPVWSPDSRWLAYAKVLHNQLSAVFVYSLETGKAREITDGMSDALYPAFDRSGKNLFFAASTDIGPAASWLDMSGLNRPVTRSVYAVVLRKNLPSPLAPESDEEKKLEEAKEEVKKAEKTEPPRVEIDFDRVTQRTVALPIPAENYLEIQPGQEGVIFLVQGPRVLPIDGKPPALTAHKFDLKTRKVERLLEGALAVAFSENGEKMLYKQEEKWFVAGTAEPPKPGGNALKLDEAEVFVDPTAEWSQMYREVWRIERDFFYDPGHHGLDLEAAERKYQAWMPGIAGRADLNYLFEEMLGELSVGHMFVAGGDAPEPPKVKGGLLGADFEIVNGRYRFKRVYDGESWNPDLRAPLTQPGVNVTAGEYLLGVNGREIAPPESVFRPFEATAGKAVVIKVGPRPDAQGAREVTVVPVDDESGLRTLAWIESNRRKVDELSKGRLAYVYLPDTAGGGYTNFNRYFFAQLGKEGVVLDERFNQGGLLADYIIDQLRRPVMSYLVTREGENMSFPAGSIYGPKAMIINEYAGSGGDAMPWYFRRAGTGPLIGKRTWGGLVGIWNYPPLIDGGLVTAPRGALYGLEGEWEVENVGIAPDIEVELHPKAMREGRDPQLEKAVEVLLSELGRQPLLKHRKPAYPNYHSGREK